MIRHAVLIGALLGILAFAPWQSAFASLIFVNTLDDELNSDGDCSLREAIESANTNTSVDDCTAGQSTVVDSIFFAVGGTVTLQGNLGPLVITDRVTLTGGGPDTTVITQGSTIQLLLIEMANPSHDVEISDLTFQGGHAVPGLFGGAVRLMEGDTFEFNNVHFLDNMVVVAPSQGWGGGGALFAGPLLNSSDPTLRLEDCLFENNMAVRESGTLSRGYGGAVMSRFYQDNGTPTNDPLDALTIVNSEFRNNGAEKHGTAVHTLFVPQVAISGSQFVDNEILLSPDGALRSGAVYAASDGSGLLSIANSSFVGNQSPDRGSAALISNFPAVISNSTFTQNSTSAVYFYNGGTSAVQYSTLVDNGTDSNFDTALTICETCTVSLRASIVWNSWDTDSICNELPGGTLNSLGYNIDNDGSCTGHGSDLPSTNPLLMPLDTWGDNIAALDLLTFLPIPGGPAVDAAYLDNCPGALGGNVTTDARGEPKPVDGSETGQNLCDIGAVEYQFDEDPEIVSVTVNFAGNGEGLVTSNPPGINCSDDCSGYFQVQTNLRLTATPTGGAVFDGWGGDCSGTGLCQFSLNSNSSVTATFSISDPDDLFSSGFE